MRIALFQDRLRVGGTESQSVALAGAFAAAGHEILLLTVRPGGALRSRVSPDLRLASLQQRDLHLDGFAPGLVRHLRAFGPDVVQLMGRVAHLHGWRLLRALPGARIVATVRTGKPLPWLCRLTLSRAHAVVTNSLAAARRLERDYAISGPRVRVIRNAALVQAGPPPGVRTQVRDALGTPPGAVVFCCAAMMRPGKGHRELLEIAGGLRLDPPWELWLAGDGSERAACVRLARKHRLGDRVRFLGVRDDLTRLLAAADIAVLASRRGIESLPNFLVEAQWAGLPAIATDVDGVGEAFLSGESGILVPDGDVEAFRAAMHRLANDAPARMRASAAAHAHARREFDPDRQNQRYLDLFAELVNAR